ncbi:IS66 family insertion sequence element accessory protein TnpB [Intestinibacter bartlettii]
MDGLALIVENQPKKDSYQNVLFVFFNKSMNQLKVLYFDGDF